MCVLTDHHKHSNSPGTEYVPGELERLTVFIFVNANIKIM